MAGMKSTATIVCTILLSSHSTRATRAPFHRGGLFQRPGWRRRSTARQSNTALILFPRGGDDVLDSAVAEEATSSSATEDQSLDDRVNAAMRRLGLGGDDATTESSSVS